MTWFRSVFLGTMVGLLVGAGDGDAQDAASLLVYPRSCFLKPRSRQQLAVRVARGDGTTRDVTRFASFSSTDPLVVGVNADGLVTSFEQPGQAWILVRYGKHLGRCRVVVRAEQPALSPPFPKATFVDEHLARMWRELGLRPAPQADDYTFLRRATLQLIGRLPTKSDIDRYMNDGRPKKDVHLITRLLLSREYATHFANMWADALRLPYINRAEQNLEAVALYHWIRRSVASDRPISDFAAHLIQAHGTAKERPAVVWQATVGSPLLLARDTATVFAGRRFRCARCHRHPRDGKPTERFRSFAACFEQVTTEQVNVRAAWLPPLNTPVRRLWRLTPITFRDRASQAVSPSLPDGTGLVAGPREDYRCFVTEWLTAGKRPRLAKAIVNYTWAYLFSRGLVDPADDMSPDNPPVHPELLDALVDDFIRNNWSMRRLLQVICTSRAYRLASRGLPDASSDVCTSAAFPVQTIPPGMLYNALRRLDGRSSPPTTARRVSVTDKLEVEHWSLFRPYDVRFRTFNPFADLVTTDRCERYHLLDRPEPEQLIAMPSLQREWQQAMIAIQRTTRRRISTERTVDHLFRALLGRPPTREQRSAVVEYLNDGRSSRSQRLQQVISTLMQTQEFLTIR